MRAAHATRQRSLRHRAARRPRARRRQRQRRVGRRAQSSPASGPSASCCTLQPRERGNALQADVNDVIYFGDHLRLLCAVGAGQAPAASSCRCRPAVSAAGRQRRLAGVPARPHAHLSLKLSRSTHPTQKETSMKKILCPIAAAALAGAGTAGAGAAAAHDRQLRRRERQRAEEGLLRAVREGTGRQGRARSNTTASRPRSRRWSRPRRSPGTSSRSNRPTSPAAATKGCSRSSTTQDRPQGRLLAEGASPTAASASSCGRR